MENLFSFREPVSPVRLRVAFAGDFCPGAHGSSLARDGRASDVLAPLAPFLSDCDLRMVQFETPLTRTESPIPKTGPNLISAPESADIIRGLFDVALLANNHTGDQGPDVVLETIGELRARGIRTVGAGANLDEAAAPLRIDAGGRPLSILNFAEFEFGIAEESSPGAAPQRPSADMRAVAAEVAAGRTVIVVFHGGHEHFPFPSPRLRDLCRLMAEAGASLVINCHEHCPQGVEWHGGVPIIYCPGNFWFPPWNEGAAKSLPFLWNYGYVAKVLFDDAGPFAMELLPVHSGPDGVRPLEGDARAAFLEYVARISEPIGDAARLRSLFESWCTDNGRKYLSISAKALPEDWLREHRANNWESPITDPRPFLEMRNIFTCESHHDLVRTYLRMTVEGHLPDALRIRPGLSALQNPEFALPQPPATFPRAEMLDFLESNVFGRVPEAARNPLLSFEEISPEAPAMDGRAVRRRVRARFSGPGGEGAIDILAFIPASAGKGHPVPAALLLCNRDPAGNMDPERKLRTSFWDAERIVARGWAAVAIHTGSSVPDKADGFDGHLQSLFVRPGETKQPDSWGTIAAWAWCGSRAMDWIATEPRIDAGRVMVAGHSRCGKTALWCAAQDERFAIAVSSCSGCGGAKLNGTYLPASEHIAQIVKGFPFWFCGNFAAYAGHDAELPFDQHWLLALVAPRRLYISSATLDSWAGQPGEFLAAKAASRAWRDLGLEGLPEGALFPEPDHPVLGGRVAYNIHSGEHTILSSDWDRWIDFAEER